MSLAQFSTGELVDLSIIGVYLLVTLIIGVYFGRNVDTMQGYAIGDRNYVTTTLVVALFATAVGGGSTIGHSEKAFTIGITYAFVSLGSPISYWITSRYLAPCLGRFHERNMLSAGEIMGSIYGTPGQVITGVAGVLRCLAPVGAQIGAAGYLCYYLFEIPYVWGIFIAGGITALYSAFGGIRSVTATDIVQFVILVCALPLLCHYGLFQLGGRDPYNVLWQSVPKENITLFPTWESFAKYFPWFLVFCMPRLRPTVTQRLLMAGSTSQAADMTRLVALLKVILLILTSLIGLLALGFKSDLEPNLALPYLVKTILPAGMKGIVISGLLAAFMSTADSCLNSASVCLLHDVVDPLRRRPLENHKKLFLSKLTAFSLGITAIIFPLLLKNVIDIILSSLQFWAPIVIIPLIVGIRGHRSSIRSFLIATGAGVAMSFVWKPLLGGIIPVPSILPAILANGLAFWIARKFDTHENIFIPEWEKSTPWFKDWEKKRALLKKQEQDQEEGGQTKAASLSARVAAVRQAVAAWPQKWVTAMQVGWAARAEQCRDLCQPVAVFGLFHALMPYSLWFGALPNYSVHILLWRFVCGGLCGVLLLYAGFSVRSRHWLPWVWYGTVTWCLPTTVTYMLWHSGLSASWVGASLAAVAILSVLLDPLSLFIVSGTGLWLGTTLYALTTGTLSLPMQTVGTLSLLQFEGLVVLTAVSLILFSRQQKQTYVAREDAYRVLSGRLGHEMRTPLASMLGEAQCALTNLDALQDLLRQAKLAGAGAALLNELRESCQAVARVANATLSMVEMLLMNLKDKPDTNFKVERCSMHACVEAALSEYPYRFGERSRVLWCKGSDFFFSASLVPMKHLVFNLLRNALTYVRFEGGKVMLECKIQGRFGVLNLWDNGPGILPEAQAHLFDRFHSGTAGGTGLGLHLCKYLAICFGGDISVQSELGVGTRFTVRFPLI